MKTLLLDKVYRPISFIGYRRTARLVLTGKATVISEWSGMPFYNGLNYPAIIVLKRYVRKKPLLPRFNFRGVFRRDFFTCFTGDVRVLLATGQEKPISLIKAGDVVIDAFGKHQRVIQVGSRTVDKLLTVKFRGSFEPMKVTPEHPFLVREDSGFDFKPISDSSVQYGRLPRNFGYTGARGKLCVYNFLPRNKMYKLLDGEIKPVNRSQKPGIPLFIDRSSGFSYLLGLYVAEGSFSGGNVVFSFGLHERSTLAADVIRIVKNVFGLTGKENINEKRNTCKIIISSTVLGEFLSHLCGKRSDGKQTPWEAIGIYHREYLQGLFLGDAYIYRDKCKVTLDMTSFDVVTSARSMLWSFGIYSNLYTVKREGKKQTWQAILQGENYSSFMTCIIGESVEDRKPSYGDDDHILSLIKSKDELIGSYDVFNIEVDGSNTYIANGVAVHNCQYTGESLPPNQLTVDHVIPRSRGGKSTWENCVTASLAVNAAKADRTPEEAGLKLLRPATAPPDSLALEYAVMQTIHPDWEPYFPGVERRVNA